MLYNSQCFFDIEDMNIFLNSYFDLDKQKHTLILRITSHDNNSKVTYEIALFPKDNTNKEKIVKILRKLKDNIETIISMLSDIEVIE